MAGRDIFGPASRSGATLVAVLLVLAPGRAESQAVHIVHLPVEQHVIENAASSSSLRFEPWGGVLFDAYRNDGGNGRPAWIGAVRLGYELAGRPGAGRRGWRLVAEVARAEAAEAGTAELQDSLEVGFRSEWWLLTGGVEWDAVTGWMGMTLEAGAGAVWLQREIIAGDSIPPGTPGTDERAESEPFPALTIGVSVWRHLTHAVQVRLRVEDIVTDPLDGLEHSPAIGLGFRFVFE